MSEFKKRNVGKLAEEKAQAFVLHHVRDLIDQRTLQHRLPGSSIFFSFFFFLVTRRPVLQRSNQ